LGAGHQGMPGCVAWPSSGGLAREVPARRDDAGQRRQGRHGVNLGHVRPASAETSQLNSVDDHWLEIRAGQSIGPGS
jgi:hypothetical protein